MYYVIFKPFLDTKTVKVTHSIRMFGGIWIRILYGGIVEEVLMRFGVMTFFVWIGSLIFGDLRHVVFWSAIVLSGLLFGIGHLPSYIMFGCKKSRAFISAVISLNLWAGIFFGWLYWKHGLVAAMIAISSFI